jgi:cysteinyl-tRNA synthetase
LKEALATAGVAEGAGAAAAAQSATGDGSTGAPFESAPPSALAAEVAALRIQFEESLEDDFNTAKAQGHLFEIAKAINRAADSPGPAEARAKELHAAGKALRAMGETIGLFWGGPAAEEEVPEEVQALVRKRDESRVQKQWRRADELRDEIAALGYVLEDSKEGTRARRKT